MDKLSVLGSTWEERAGRVAAEIVGSVYGSAWKAGEIRAQKPLLKKARELGKKLAAR